MSKLSCDMEQDCTAPVARIDIKGFVYCEHHGAQRKLDMPCRKLLKREIATLESGKTISWSHRKPRVNLAENPPADWEDCGCCGGCHPPDYSGDCRDDRYRWPSKITTGEAAS